LISIHTPAKGVTYLLQDSITSLSDFNPHSREGSDSNTATVLPDDIDFNPHSREGSDSNFT